MIKKLILILILFIISGNFASADTQSGYADYNIYQYSFNKEEAYKFIKNAKVYMKAWENSIVKINREYYLREAMKYYFLTTKIDKGSMEANIGLGRVYDELNQDELALKHFYLAYNIDNTNPKLNYYFGNFYYKRNELIKADFHYRRAYTKGYNNNFDLNYKLGKLYEKLADIESAKEFYTKALRIAPENPELANKIRLLDELNYSCSQYYLFKK